MIIDTRTFDRETVNWLGGGRFELTDAEGSWIGDRGGGGNQDFDQTGHFVMLAGRGGYDGLSAYAFVDHSVELNTYVGTVF